MRFLLILVMVISMAVPAQAAPCLSVIDIQAIVDAAPNGNPSNLKAKLRNGGHGYTQVSFAGQCSNEVGTVFVTNRHGLWIERASFPNVSWVVVDSNFIIFTGADAESITINGGSARVEVFHGKALTVTNVSPLYGGKIYANEVYLDTLTGFFRNSIVGDLTVTGYMKGFSWTRGVSWETLSDTSTR